MKCQVKIKPFCSYHFDFSALAVQGFSRGDFISVAALFIQMLTLAAAAQLALPNCSQHHRSPSLTSCSTSTELSLWGERWGPRHALLLVPSSESLLFQGNRCVWGWDRMGWGGMAWEGMDGRSKVQLQLTLVISELV